VLPLAAALATGAVAAPSVAAKPTHDKSTNVLLRAARSTVAPKHKVSLTATLKSAKHRLAGEELWLEKRDAGTHKFGNPVDIGTTDSNGQVTVPVVPGNHKGAKEQYRVVFQGDTGYKASHSSVITVTVSAPSG
jgi:hypothetical protein